MILIIISLIITLVVAVLLGIDWDEEEFHFRPRMLFSLFCLLIMSFGCFSTIKTGEIGIKTQFGKIVSTTSNEGIVTKLPYEKIYKMNIKVQKYENKNALDTSTKDMQIVGNIKVSVNYQIDGTKAIDLYKKVGINYDETILEPAIQETVKGVISKYTAEELVVKRSEVSLDICKTLDNRINNYGINCVSVTINNFDFSSAYNLAIEQKAVAEQEVQTSKNQLEKAKIDAEKKKIEAQGEAEANKLLEKSLTKEIIEQQFIEKWDGKLPETYAGDNIMGIINLKK